MAKIHPIWDRCYDYNFMRFLQIFGKKMAFFSKANVMIKFLQKLTVVRAKSQYFRQIFRRKYF
jgi:hypothetical protein